MFRIATPAPRWPACSGDATLALAHVNEHFALDDLLVSAGSGDVRAFERLYEQIGGRVFSTVRWMVRDVAQAQEISRDAFVELWRTAGQYSPDQGSAVGRVMAMAHRLAVARLRRARTHEPVWGEHLSDASSQPVADSHTPNPGVLERLSEAQREAVTLAYYHGLTYTEIGEIRRIPSAEVRTLLHDALVCLSGRS